LINIDSASIELVCELLKTNSKEFIEASLNEVLPTLVQRLNVDALKKAATVTKQDYRHMLASASGFILSDAMISGNSFDSFREVLLAGELDDLQLFRLNPLSLITSLTLKLGSHSELVCSINFRQRNRWRGLRLHLSVPMSRKSHPNLC
jgi:hypothetical protein